MSIYINLLSKEDLNSVLALCNDFRDIFMMHACLAERGFLLVFRVENSGLAVFVDVSGQSIISGTYIPCTYILWKR